MIIAYLRRGLFLLYDRNPVGSIALSAYRKYTDKRCLLRKHGEYYYSVEIKGDDYTLINFLDDYRRFLRIRERYEQSILTELIDREFKYIGSTSKFLPADYRFLKEVGNTIKQEVKNDIH